MTATGGQRQTGGEMSRERDARMVAQANTPDVPATPAEPEALDLVSQAIEDAKDGATVGESAALDAVSQAVEEVREIYQERYQALVQATGQITWTTTAEGLAEDMPGWRTFTGQIAEEVRGLGWLAAVHPDDHARALDDWSHAVTSGGLYETEFRLRRADGVYRDVLARGVPVRHYDGTIREWVGFCADITERKGAEERYRSLFETMAQGVVYQDAAGRITSANSAAQRILALTLDDLRGYAPTDERWAIIHEDGSAVPLAEQPPMVALRTGRPVREVVMGIRHPDLDEERWLRVTSVPLDFSDSGRPQQVYTIFDDITERKRAREELEQAKEAAEDANQAKSAFLANMSHELRTPLNAVIGYSEMLQEEAEDLDAPDLIPDLEKIHTAGKALLSLVNDVLDLSKIEAGKMDLYLETFDVAAMIADVTATVEPLIDKKRNRLEADIAPNVGAMHADLTKTRQTLFNLLSNAAKFTEQGTIALTAARATVQGRDHIVFRVTDSGIGMTAAQIDKLFQPFTQADASTTRKFGGTGLGLTITRLLCQMMGGDITVESTPGQGSTFTITLPADVAAREEQGEERAEDSAAHGADGGNIVLVVDDDLVVHDLMTRYLTREGFVAVTTSDGDEALRLAKELRPIAVTLDVMMPRMDGWTVLTALKADPATADIPVIMLSMVQDKNLGFALGASEYLPKPVDRARLAAVLSKYRLDGQDSTVLVVDDDPLNRNGVKGALEGEGFTVVTAENGKQGLDRLAEVTPRVILLDLMMPEMDGFRFAEELRARAEWRAIPVIVMTSKDLTPEDRRRLHGRVEEVVQKKAYSRDELLREMRDLVAAYAHPHPANA